MAGIIIYGRVFGEPIYYSDYNFVSVRNLTKVYFRVWCRLNFCLHSYFFRNLRLTLGQSSVW